MWLEPIHRRPTQNWHLSWFNRDITCLYQVLSGLESPKMDGKRSITNIMRDLQLIKAGGDELSRRIHWRRSESPDYSNDDVAK